MGVSSYLARSSPPSLRLPSFSPVAGAGAPSGGHRRRAQSRPGDSAVPPLLAWLAAEQTRRASSARPPGRAPVITRLRALPAAGRSHQLTALGPPHGPAPALPCMGVARHRGHRQKARGKAPSGVTALPAGPPEAMPARRRSSRLLLLALASAICLALALIWMTLSYLPGAEEARGHGMRAPSSDDLDNSPRAPLLYSYSIAEEYPHDAKAFTQGLLYLDKDVLYESTGNYGESSVRKVALKTGKVKKERKAGAHVFGEGLAYWQGRLLQVAWRVRKGFIYNSTSLKLLGEFHHPMTDGWGLTTDNTQLIGSDGTSTLYFMDPVKVTEKRRVIVRDSTQEVHNLNELEYINGEIWANVWLTECIARISPRDGRVVGWGETAGPELANTEGTDEGSFKSLMLLGLDVLNGIAWDQANRRLFVTGKWWPKLYEIHVHELPKSNEADLATARAACIL
eukprot:SM000026S08997  [mRNA]  locus=s26:892657:896354:+ [translate_table: standard]